VAARSDYLAVHVLVRRHIGLARLFGGQTRDQVDKFDRCSWHIGYLVEPVTGDAAERSDDLVSFSDVADLEPGYQA
jgi:hypothetical protein